MKINYYWCITNTQKTKRALSLNLYNIVALYAHKMIVSNIAKGLEKMKNSAVIPEGTIIFLSGVPGAGKTTISYELMSSRKVVRYIQETDVLRETLLGYNKHISSLLSKTSDDRVSVKDNSVLLDFAESKKQCEIMEKSFKNIIIRQQRRTLSTVINGVHIVPESLQYYKDNKQVLFINLFVNNEDAIKKRIYERDPASYMLQEIPFIFKANQELHASTTLLSQNVCSNTFFSIDTTNLTIDETLDETLKCINKKITSA